MRRSAWVAGLACIVIVLVGCQNTSSGTSTTGINQNPPSGGYLEPPMLAAQVAAGKLPPVAQRLPEHPFVVGPGVLIQSQYENWQDGKYGGTITAVAPFAEGLMNIAGGATILRSPGQTTGASLPNVVSAFTHSSDYTTFDFTLRKGLKWSDGQPVTTEDVRFTLEDIYGDATVNRPWPTDLCTQGDCDLGHAQLTILDQYSFELKFGKPYGFFVASLNSWIDYYDFLIKPSHYLKQFHAKYANPGALAALVSQNHVASWAQLLNQKDVSHWLVGEPSAIGMPVLNAWVVTKSTDTEVTYERNPYFWHVDQSGHQLPYADRIVTEIVPDPNVEATAVAAGQATIAVGPNLGAQLNDMPLFRQNAKRSNLHVFLTGSFNNPICLFLNHDYDYQTANSVWQQLMSDSQHRFGRALAAAMDPVDVNKTVYFGLYGKLFFPQDVHDTSLANRLLDDLGMKKDSGTGFRSGPDGKPFVFRITYSAFAADFDPVAELLKQHIEAVGIQVQLERITADLFSQRAGANELQASLLWNDGPAWSNGMSSDYQPEQKGAWSPETWTYFTTSGKQGRQPPSYMQSFYDLETTRRQFPPASSEGQKIWAQMLQWMQTNYAFIPTAGAKVTPNVVDARLRNVPNQGAPFDLDTYINAEGTWFATS